MPAPGWTLLDCNIACCGSGSGGGSGNLPVDCLQLRPGGGPGISFTAEWISGPACLVGQTGTIHHYSAEPGSPPNGWWEGGTGILSGGQPGVAGVCGVSGCDADPTADYNVGGWIISFACESDLLYALGLFSAPPTTCVGGYIDGTCCQYLHVPDNFEPGFHRFHVIAVSYSPVVIDILMDWYVEGPVDGICDGSPWGDEYSPGPPELNRVAFTAVIRLTEVP